MAALAAVLVPAAAASDAESAQSPSTRSGGWTTTIDTTLSRHSVGLPADAPASRLARRALARHAERLRLDGSLAGVRLAGRSRIPGGDGARPLQQLRFRQTVGGLRVVWSQIDVTIAAGRVRSMAATVVPLEARLRGTVRVSRQRALAIARRAVAGRERALRPLAAAYAGSPTRSRQAEPRRARRVWVVEVQPARIRDQESPTGLCIVVDAGTGKVLARWPGMAARPLHGPDARGASGDRRARAAQAPARRVLLLTVHDGRASVDTPPLYAQFAPEGRDPRTADWPAWFEAILPGVTRSTVMDAATANSANVARTICTVRGFCGSQGGLGQPPIYRNWRVTVTSENDSRAESFRNDVYLSSLDTMDGNGDPNQPANDMVAHEMGHIMDWVHAGDRDQSASGMTQEVEEALADMFAYEYDRFDATIGEDARLRRNLGDPDSAFLRGQAYPDHVSEYDRTPPGGFPHYNSTILSHAYYRFVQAVGHAKAGHVLHAVPSFLSPRPTFTEVARAFRSRAGTAYGDNVADAAEAAFTAVGVGP